MSLNSDLCGKVAGDLPGAPSRNSGGICVSRPVGDGGANRINEGCDRGGFYPERPPDRLYVLAVGPAPLSGDSEMVLAAGTVKEADVISRRQAPAAPSVHQEPDAACFSPVEIIDRPMHDNNEPPADPAPAAGVVVGHLFRNIVAWQNDCFAKS